METPIPNDCSLNNDENDDDKKVKKPKSVHAVTKLVNQALSAFKFFYNAKFECFVKVPHNSTSKILELKSIAFARVMRVMYQLTHKDFPNSTNITEAVLQLESMIIEGGIGTKDEVHFRIAKHGDNIYLDLCNDEWTVIKISSHGWEEIKNPPVNFIRSPQNLALPKPIRGGTVQALRKYVNIRTDDAWALYLGFLIQLFNPEGSYPHLVVIGPHSSAKSTLCEFTKLLIDPNDSMRIALPTEADQLMMITKFNQVLIFENLSHLSLRDSDNLSKLSTGCALSKRTLYANTDQTSFKSRKPCMINCIEQLVTKGDLLSRCILLDLPEIPKTERVDEVQYNKDFNSEVPHILGALLDAVSFGLQNSNLVPKENLPRMSGFYIWVNACEFKLGLPKGSFSSAYLKNISNCSTVTLENDSVGLALQVLVSACPGQQEVIFNGTAQGLLLALQGTYGNNKVPVEFPSAPNKLKARLDRLVEAIREELGIEVQSKKTKSGKYYIIKRVPITGDDSDDK